MMNDVKRYTFKGAAGEYVYAADFEKIRELHRLNCESHAETMLLLGQCREDLEQMRSLLSSMTSDYACCLEAGYDRITFLGGDCDSVQKMLSDNPNYSKAIAAINLNNAPNPPGSPGFFLSESLTCSLT